MKNKAEYCLNCINKPCAKGCPLNNDIPSFIQAIKNEELKMAYDILSETTCLSSICGRICPHNKQCQSLCTRKYKGEPVEIGELEAYIGDLAIKNNWYPNVKQNNNKKIAIIGSGPSSLTCAYFLIKDGFNVTIYEKYNELGGILNHSIPSFRLDKKILKETIDRITKKCTVNTNMELGKEFEIKDIINDYDAIYLGIGSNISNKLNIPGEDLKNVIGGNELLEHKPNYDFNNKVVIINGGGNVAMDVAREIIRKKPKKVIVLYRRSEKEMPAEIKEISEAKKEGIEFIFQTNILNINGKNKVENIEVIKTELIEEKGTRPIPVNIEGTNYTIKCDYLIKAIGSKPDIELLNKLNIEIANNKIVVDENYKTSNNKIYAGGDLTNKNCTVAFAAQSGKKAAYSIIKELS